MKIIGHRGAKGLAPENSQQSLAKAIKYKVDEIEVDVQVTADGVAILEHDFWMDDAQGKQYPVKEHTHAELVDIKSTIITLTHGLKFVNRCVPVQVECKPGIDTAVVVADIQKLLDDGWQPSDIVLSSRSYRTLRALHRALPQNPLCVIESWSSVRAVWRARRLRTKRISMNARWLWSGVIRSLHRGGYTLAIYTINDPRRIKHWRRSHIWAVITDYPNHWE